MALAQANFFAGLTPDSRRILAERCNVRQACARTVLFREGEIGEAFYLLGRGRVRLFKTEGNEQDTTLKIIMPGEVFAEVILFESERYPVDAVVIEDALLFAIPRKGFRALLDRPDFRDDFIATLMRKQRYLAQALHTRQSNDVDERLLSFLREATGGRDADDFRLSKRETAGAIGARPETVSRALARLSDKGILSWQGHRLRWMGAG